MQIFPSNKRFSSAQPGSIFTSVHNTRWWQFTSTVCSPILYSLYEIPVLEHLCVHLYPSRYRYLFYLPIFSFRVPTSPTGTSPQLTEIHVSISMKQGLQYPPCCWDLYKEKEPKSPFSGLTQTQLINTSSHRAAAEVPQNHITRGMNAGLVPVTPKPTQSEISITFTWEKSCYSKLTQLNFPNLYLEEILLLQTHTIWHFPNVYLEEILLFPNSTAPTFTWEKSCYSQIHTIWDFHNLYLGEILSFPNSISPPFSCENSYCSQTHTIWISPPFTREKSCYFQTHTTEISPPFS